MMDHTQVQERFSEYWERGLDEATSREVAGHLASCAACRAEYATFEKAMLPLGKLHRVPAPDMKESVPALIHRRSRGRFFGERSWKSRVPLEWLSLMMLGVIVLIYLAIKLSHPSVRVG